MEVEGAGQQAKDSSGWVSEGPSVTVVAHRATHSIAPSTSPCVRCLPSFLPSFHSSSIRLLSSSSSRSVTPSRLVTMGEGATVTAVSVCRLHHASPPSGVGHATRAQCMIVCAVAMRRGACTRRIASHPLPTAGMPVTDVDGDVSAVSQPPLRPRPVLFLPLTAAVSTRRNQRATSHVRAATPATVTDQTDRNA